MAETKNIAVKLNIIEPRKTEKTFLEQTKRTYVFPVDLTTSKQEVKKLVEKEFNVTVTDVRVLTRKGKKTRFSRGKHAYPGTTYRKDKKFAYVTLKEGDLIKLVEDAPSEEKKTKKTSAKEAKADKKAEADMNAGKENK